MTTLTTASSWTYAEAMGLDAEDEAVLEAINDARVLIEYQIIKRDAERLAKAQDMSRQMLAHEMEQLDAHRAAVEDAPGGDE